MCNYTLRGQLRSTGILLEELTCSLTAYKCIRQDEGELDTENFRLPNPTFLRKSFSGSFMCIYVPLIHGAAILRPNLTDEAIIKCLA